MKSKYNIFFYSLLAKYQLFRTFGSKIVFVSILSAIVPLVPFVMVLVYYNLDLKLVLSLSLLFISAFLIGMVLLSIFIKSLISPVFMASTTLRDYINNSKKPNLPLTYKDELGVLMFQVQEFIEKIDTRLNLLKKDLMVDHLTGVYNRQSAEETIRDELSSNRKSDERVVLAMFDIDDFKIFNDKFGHGFGDQCLIEVVETFKINLRENDWIARWGGDEFLIFFRNVDYQTSEAILKRVMRFLDKVFLKTQDDKFVKLTVSIGLFEVVNEDLNTAIKKVDTALLQAKKKGKSVIVRYDELTE